MKVLIPARIGCDEVGCGEVCDATLQTQDVYIDGGTRTLLHREPNLPSGWSWVPLSGGGSVCYCPKHS